ncbi:MAG: hypothetical protein QNK25_08705 [Desulfobacterales bacterium]|nr:hypothetical protein [Desulfobacterales bacterium]
MDSKKQQLGKKERQDGPKFKLNMSIRMAELEGQDLPEAMVYAFDGKNRFVDKKPLKGIKDGKVSFDLPRELKNEKIRVVVGPRLEIEPISQKTCLAWKLPDGIHPVSENSKKLLLNRGGVEAKIRLREAVMDRNMTVRKDDLLKWLTCTCTVRGRLIKSFQMPDGSTRELGVCHACVYIWEVDHYYVVLAKLPEYELLRFRDELIDIIERWPPEPWPPFPDPPGPGPGPYSQPMKYKPVAFKSMAGELSDVRESMKSMKREQFEAITTAPSTVALRREILNKADALAPYLCYFPWIYGYFDKEFITCTCTDSSGYFERDIEYSCSGDKPDLYFTAHQCIDSNWVTLYDPGLSCHVHWNYECATEVLLVTNEQGAKICADDTIDPPSGVYTWVEPHGIGGKTLSEITDGRVDYVDNGHLVENAPFGANLGFRMGHSNNIPNTNVYYYRLLYRKRTSSLWYESIQPVTRHYIHEENDEVTFPTVPLGPVGVKGMHLYRFKPDSPKDIDKDLTGSNQWPEDPLYNSDLYSGYLNTTNFPCDAEPAVPGGFESAVRDVKCAHGLYQIKIEVYDVDGNLVNPYDSNPDFEFIMPTAPDSPSEATPTEVAPSENQDGSGFVFDLFIDNRSCLATIDLPVVGGDVIDEDSPEGFDCGFMYYDSGDKVKVAFNASQPGNNAEATFTLKRGNQKLNDMSLTRVEVATSLFSGLTYTNDSDGDFHKTVDVGDILGKCTNAAFAEHLHVYAKAFNGWHRISWHDGRWYDASALRAFALALEDESDDGGGS